MKYILTIISCIFLFSCSKIIDEVDAFRKETQSADTVVTAPPKASIQLLLNLNEGSQNTADGVVVFYDNAFKKSIGNEDSYKWANADENLAINERDTLLSIEGKQLSNNDTTALQTWNFRQASYYFKIVTANFPTGYSATFNDVLLQTSTTIELNATTYIPFDAVDNIPNRFSINIKKQ